MAGKRIALQDKGRKLMREKNQGNDIQETALGEEAVRCGIILKRCSGGGNSGRGGGGSGGSSGGSSRGMELQYPINYPGNSFRLMLMVSPFFVPAILCNASACARSKSVLVMEIFFVSGISLGPIPSSSSSSSMVKLALVVVRVGLPS